jgi:hypothetical protein
LRRKGGVKMSYFSPLIGKTNAVTTQLQSYQIGYRIIGQVLSASAIDLITSTATNISSITIPAGTWAVEGYLGLIGTATSIGPLTGVDITNQTTGGIGNLSVETSVSLPIVGTSIAASNPFGIMTSKKIITIAYGATETWYLTTNITFSGGTCGGCGWIKATRIG